jgi:hypothetical protein
LVLQVGGSNASHIAKAIELAIPVWPLLMIDVVWSTVSLLSHHIVAAAAAAVVAVVVVVCSMASMKSTLIAAVLHRESVALVALEQASC